MASGDKCSQKRADETMKQQRNFIEMRNARNVMNKKITIFNKEPEKKIRKIPPIKVNANAPMNRRERRAQNKKPKGLWTED